MDWYTIIRMVAYPAWCIDADEARLEDGKVTLFAQGERITYKFLNDLCITYDTGY